MLCNRISSWSISQLKSTRHNILLSSHFTARLKEKIDTRSCYHTYAHVHTYARVSYLRCFSPDDFTISPQSRSRVLFISALLRSCYELNEHRRSLRSSRSPLAYLVKAFTERKTRPRYEFLPPPLYSYRLFYLYRERRDARFWLVIHTRESSINISSMGCFKIACEKCCRDHWNCRFCHFRRHFYLFILIFLDNESHCRMHDFTIFIDLY